MKNIILICLFLIINPTQANDLHSPYAGEQNRSIKSLSEKDIKALRNGEGWGLAKAAELNGVPGPVHLLEMQKEIQLTPEQTQKIKKIYEDMKSKAILLGEALIETERKINMQFSSIEERQQLTESHLKALLNKASNIRAELRLTHLATHLQTPEILSTTQIKTYNQLRGYSNADCNQIPQGHNPEMWKLHNDC